MRQHGNCQRNVFEVLESRSYLSSVNILDYGAKAGDNVDDSSAIRAAVNASKDGDTILFPAGQFDIGSPIVLKGNRDYISQGALLVGDPTIQIFKLHEDNVRIDGFTFDGKPIFMDRGEGKMLENIVINNNTFHVHAKGDGNAGVIFTTGLRNSSITNNTFDPLDADTGIYGYYWDHLTIANNQLLNGNEGIHLTDFGNGGDDSRDLLIEQNYFSGLHRMGVEIQGGGANTIIQDNYYENPVMTSTFHDNDSTFAFSIIADRSTGSIIRRNTSIAPDRPDGKGVRIVFEVGGDNTLVEENYSVGSNAVLASNDGNGSTSVTAKNNLFKDYLMAPLGRALTQDNNGPSVELSWNVNRGKPGPNKRLTLDSVVQEDGENTPTPPAINNWAYLGDMKWKAATNTFGPVERDQFNGGTLANDGDPIRLNGRTYKTGLGVSGDSSITYRLDRKFTVFAADIGIDDYSGANGSVTFQVWLDGKKVYDSGLVTGSTPAKGLAIDVSKAKQLKLVTTNAGDGDRYDHADWGGARLMPKL